MMQARVISENNATLSSLAILDLINSILSPRRAAKGSRPLLPPFSNVTLFFFPFFPFYPQMFSFKYRLLPLFASFQPFQLIQHRFRPSFLEIKPNVRKMRLKRGQKPVKDKSKGGVDCGGVGGQSVETIKAEETPESS